jgi:chorismate mutase
MLSKGGFTLWCRGIRGATIVSDNTKEAIIAATRELLEAMVKVNKVETDDIACIWFTTTPDLNAAFPAAAARDMGWNNVALLCSHEMNVPGSLPCCLRILMLVNTTKKSDEIVHVYLKGTEVLREGV